MSTSKRSLSGEELLKLALDKFLDMKTEMEKAVSERDSLKREVKELKLKLIEADKTVEFYKARVRAVIEQNASTEKPNPNPNLSDSADLTPLKFIRSFSNKRKRKFVKDCGTGEEEAGGHTNNSGVSKTEDDDHNQACRARRTRVVGATCQLNPIINKIKENLTEESLKKFEESCFGHLLKNNELQFQGQLLFQLVQHMDMGASNKKRLVFNINNSSLSFGPREFSLITGLRLGTMEATAKTTSSSSPTQNKILKGINPRMLLQNMDKDFLNVGRVGKGKDELALKVALLHFLYGILFAGTRCVQVEEKYLHLIEDLHKFNAYPWGRVAYQFLASSMLSARKSFGSSKPCLYTYGLSLALQVWAYEVMPSLAEYCAVCANNPKDRIPRILRWSSIPNKKIRFKDLEKFFTPGDEAHLVLHGIRASPWELEMLTTGSTIPPQPKKGKLAGDHNDQISSHAATPSPTHHPARASTQTNAHHVMRAEMQTHPLVDVISDKDDHDDDDDDDDDDDVDEDVDDNVDEDNDQDEADAMSNSQSNDSDDEISDGFMNKLVAGITRKTS